MDSKDAQAVNDTITRWYDKQLADDAHKYRDGKEHLITGLELWSALFVSTSMLVEQVKSVYSNNTIPEGKTEDPNAIGYTKDAVHAKMKSIGFTTGFDKMFPLVDYVATRQWDETNCNVLKYIGHGATPAKRLKKEADAVCDNDCNDRDPETMPSTMAANRKSDYWLNYDPERESTASCAFSTRSRNGRKTKKGRNGLKYYAYWCSACAPQKCSGVIDLDNYKP